MVESAMLSFIGMRLMASVEWIGKSKRKPEAVIKRKPAGARGTKFALCLRNDGNAASLEIFKVYRVVSPHRNDEPRDIRIIDESGEDYLYPRENFLPIKLPAKALKRVLVVR
jgi:hypothetical protein